MTNVNKTVIREKAQMWWFVVLLLKIKIKLQTYDNKCDQNGDKKMWWLVGGSVTARSPGGDNDNSLYLQLAQPPPS